MRNYESTNLSRDVDAVQIPGGTPIVIPIGTYVTITQSLGGTYTVMTDQGYLARISGKDGDALGKEILTAPEVQANTGPVPATAEEAEEKVWDQLKTCFDPEIPVNIVDLGLVYYCKVTPREAGEGYKADVHFTLTAPGCGMGGVLQADIENKVASVPGIRETVVELVLAPQWEQDRMSEAAKLQLGLL